MQDLNDKLVVLHTVDGVSFDDVSMSAFNFFKGTFSVEDTLYVGFRKPISSVFVGVESAGSETSGLTAEYFNGSWSDLELHDETSALAESGLVRWVTPTDQTQSEVNGKSLFWIKLNYVTDTAAVLMGVGPMLCTAEDLHGVDFNLDETPLNILKAIVSARNLMCKELQVSPWDLLNLPEVTDAATFLALSSIYFNQSDRPEDNYHALYLDFLGSYRSLKAKIAITIDRNGDGIADAGEKVVSRVVYFER